MPYPIRRLPKLTNLINRLVIIGRWIATTINLFQAVHILLSLMAFLGNFLILVVKIKVFIYILQAIAFILSNSRFLFRNKWLHYWLEENICSSDLYSASQLYYYYHFFYFYFDSLSSENIACSRPSYCKTKCTVNGTIVKVDPTRFDPTPLSTVFSLYRCYRVVYHLLRFTK